jgi:hypothetical protein
MWRSQEERVSSAGERLRLADEVWGWEPHSAQRRFFCCPAQVRVAACGRRWGKTESLSIDVASLAICEARAGRDCRQLIVAPSDVQARLLGNEVLGRLLAAFDAETPWTHGLALDVRQRPSLQITVSPEGSDIRKISNDKKARAKGPASARMVFRTAGRDGASLRGLWAHRIVVDEASRVPDTVMTEVLMPMLMDVGGDYVLASSPNGKRSAFYRLFAKGNPPPPQAATPPEAGRVGLVGGHALVPPVQAFQGHALVPIVQPFQGHDARAVCPPASAIAFARGERGPLRSKEVGIASFQCPTSDNPHNDRAFLEAMRDEMGDMMYAQEIMAEFADDAGAVFREDDIVGCLETNSLVDYVRGDLLSDPVPGRIYSAGIDWGRKQDFSVLSILDATEVPARLVHLQRWQGTGWEAQVSDVAETLARFEPVSVLADGNSIGDPLAETLTVAIRDAQARIGAASPGVYDPRPVRVERFVFTADTKLQLVDRLNIGLSRRGLTYPNHKPLLAELRGFEYGRVGSSGRARMAARGSGHDDIVMGLALSWFCAPAGAPASPASRVLLGSMLRK